MAEKTSFLKRLLEVLPLTREFIPTEGEKEAALKRQTVGQRFEVPTEEQEAEKAGRFKQEFQRLQEQFLKSPTQEYLRTPGVPKNITPEEIAGSTGFASEQIKRETTAPVEKPFVSEREDRLKLLEPFGLEPKVVEKLTFDELKSLAPFLKATAQKTTQAKLMDTTPALQAGYSAETLKTYFPDKSDGELQGISRREARDRQTERLMEKREQIAHSLLKEREEISGKAMTADMKNRLIVLQDIVPQVSLLRGQLDKVPSGIFEGGLQQIGALTGQTSEDLAAYESSYRAISAGLYRAVTGDTRLSDQDAAERGYKLFPRAWQAEKVRESIWNNLYQMIEVASEGRTFNYDPQTDTYKFSPKFSGGDNKTPNPKPTPKGRGFALDVIEANKLIKEKKVDKDQAKKRLLETYPDKSDLINRQIQ